MAQLYTLTYLGGICKIIFFLNKYNHTINKYNFRTVIPCHDIIACFLGHGQDVFAAADVQPGPIVAVPQLQVGL